MTAAQVQASPDSVPGAVSDPASILGEDLTFAGAGGGTAADGGGQVNGYLARPADSRPAGAGGSQPAHPGMVVIHEAMGLGEHIRDVTNRIANLGYVALGVDLDTREGGPPPPLELAGKLSCALLAGGRHSW